MKGSIIRYNAGNIRSVSFALERLGIEPLITDDPEELRSADRVIFPGVGHAESAMKHLRSVGLDKIIPQLKQPVLGICLGMQLMCSWSEEGNTTCLGIMDCEVVSMNSFVSPDTVERIKIPHVGWNRITDLRSELFNGVDDGENVYFIHSYAVKPNAYSVAVCNHGMLFSAAIRKDNFYAVQFHPEKSGDTGKLILDNFLKIKA